MENFLKPLRVAVSCLTHHQLGISSGGTTELGVDHSLAWSDLQPVLLHSPTRGDFTFDLGMKYQIVKAEGARGPYKVQTIGYKYSLSTVVDDNEVVQFHWHPWIAGEPEPHMHIGSSQLVDGSTIRKKDRTPTGRISIEMAVAYCIGTWGAQPRRDDWKAKLAISEAVFEKWKTPRGFLAA